VVTGGHYSQGMCHTLRSGVWEAGAVYMWSDFQLILWLGRENPLCIVLQGSFHHDG